MPQTILKEMSNLENQLIHVIQGEYAVSDDPKITMATILGSCVSTCLCDPIAALGGMNHFLLPFGSSEEKQQLKYGLHSMELLINGLLKNGANKENLQAKVFGGASMSSTIQNIGDLNSKFALEFLGNEGIEIANYSIGGKLGRKLRYWPTTGHAEVFLLSSVVTPQIFESANEIRKPEEDVTIFS